MYDSTLNDIVSTFFYSQKLTIRDDTWWYGRFEIIRWREHPLTVRNDELSWSCSLYREGLWRHHSQERGSIVPSFTENRGCFLTNVLKCLNMSILLLLPRCGNSELSRRMTPCSPIVFSSPVSWNHKWAFSGLLLFVLCPFVCKCFWLYLLNHLPWHKVS